LRITWYSNAPWAPTGYGTQTKLMLPRLKAEGHEVAVAANYGQAAAMSSWRGIPVFPQGLSGHSEDVMLAHHTAWMQGQEGWLMTLYDVWPLAKIKGHEQFRVASWTPVDHTPVPPEVLPWAQAHYTIAMSKWGQQEFARKGVDARYAPHGIDTAVFKPTPSAIRETLKVPEDAFLITINAANKGGTPPRKAWSEMLSAAGLFMDRHPDAYLNLHTNLAGIGGTAPQLEVMLAALGIPTNRLRVVDQYQYLAGLISDTILAELYTASDVLLATSMGEGFGIPVIEAQAAGCPVIVTDFSAQSELCGAGWLVGFQPWFDHFQGAFLAQPFVSEIIGALEQAYVAKGDADLRGKAVAFAQDYDADRVFDAHWRPILAEMEQLLEPPKLTRQQRRAAARKAA